MGLLDHTYSARTWVMTILVDEDDDGTPRGHDLASGQEFVEVFRDLKADEVLGQQHHPQREVLKAVGSLRSVQHHGGDVWWVCVPFHHLKEDGIFCCLKGRCWALVQVRVELV